MILDRDLSVIGTFPTKGGSLNGFLDAATIWINKPHCANKRLCGTKIIQIKTADSSDLVEQIIASVLAGQNSCSEQQSPEKNNNLQVDLKENDEKFVVIIREMLPKQIKVFPCLLEAVIYDSTAHSVTFYPLSYTNKPAESDNDITDLQDMSAEVTYRFTYLHQDDLNSSIQLSCSAKLEQSVLPSFHAQASPHWLNDTLTPKIRHWTEMKNLTTKVRSLRLISLDRYSQVYSLLKDKYGTDLVKTWTESTNPEKFVYEDIGIAAYLLLLWEEDRQKTGSSRKQSFVDLGCGNGLLVYLLSKEGHPGVGIDLRKRNIWDTYGPDVHLEERPITPSADNLFPDFDWIIGNHSDELTPWIPVIAARSSYTCSYFVLPCCQHDFNRRFSGKAKGKSQYQTYLMYVAQVGQACGFEVEEDTLRIPSTKRECQIGRHRTYPEDQEPVADRQRQAFIDKRCAFKPNSSNSASDSKTSSHPRTSDAADTEASFTDEPVLKRARDDSSPNTCGLPESKSGPNSDAGGGGRQETGVWTENFQARSSKEQVRNCQKVSRETKDWVVRAVFDAVLTADGATEVVGQDGKRWRKGGSIELGTVAKMLDSATCDELKSECGGVQTLLRNHNHIFQVSGGKVQLRDFSVDNPWSQSKAAKSRKTDPATVFKTSLCWFHSNHPDGCPRTAANCSYAHGESELRPREIKRKK